MPSLELMEAAGGRSPRPRSRSPATARRGSSAARATTAATGSSPPATWPRPDYQVEVAAAVARRDELSGDAAANLERLEGAVRELGPGEVEAALGGSGVVVDAIFGTGFEGAPRDPAAAAIEAINACGAPVVAADIASGVDASTGEVEGAAVEASVTVSFHAPKLGHWIAPGKRQRGRASGGADRDSRRGARASRRRGLIRDRGARPARPPRRRTRPSSARAGADRRRLAWAHRRGLHGGRGRGAGRRRLRDGRGPRADLEPIFEIKLTEVMSVGCPGADGRLDRPARPSRSSRPPARRRGRRSARGSAAREAPSSSSPSSRAGSRRRC